MSHDSSSKKSSRKSRVSVAERLQSHAQLSPGSGELLDEPRKQLHFNRYDQSTIRVIAQFLDTLGLQNSVEALVEESGFTIEASAGARIRASILKGNYEAASSVLSQSQDLPKDVASNANYIIQCFQIADFIRKGRYLDALYTMRALYPRVLNDSSANVDFFDGFVKDVMLGGSKYKNVDATTSRNSQLAYLEEILPTDFILPQNRLKSLLNRLHGVPADEKSPKLLRDDSNGASSFRQHECVQIWGNFPTAIYCVKFSRDGKLMASGGKSNAIVLWKVRDGKLGRIGDLAPITEGNISYMEFCQKNRFLAICGEPTCKYNLTVFDVETRQVHRVLRVHNGHDDIVDIASFFTCFSFLTSPSTSMIVAGNELGALKIYNLNASEEHQPVKQVSGFRVRCIHGMRNGDNFLTVDAHNRVRLYSLTGDMGGTTICKEEVTILNMVVHPSEQLVLTTTDTNLRLWDIRSHSLVRVFSGACQREEFARYSIHATFGGVHQNFIATGTIGRETQESLRANDKRLKKNGRVVIWSVEESRPKFTLVGHRGHVNAVAWNPTEPSMIVSSGDDGTVRVWYLDRAETSDYSDIVPRLVPKRQKAMSRRAEPSNNGCSRSRTTADLIQEMRINPTSAEFEQDLEMEKMWQANRPAWKKQKEEIKY